MQKFPEKLERLMRTSGVTQRRLAEALGVSHRAVGGWLKGAAPRAEALKGIADYFGFGVEMLTDDRQSLPDQLAPFEVIEETRGYMVREPIEAAARAADRVGGTQSDRQQAFEHYLQTLRDIREEAERLAGGDLQQARTIFDRMLATWMAANDRQKH